MWNPGERQASPTSCIVALSFDVRGAEGRAVRAPDVFNVVLPDRSNFRGRCRDVGISGEEGGSFFTIIFGPCGVLDALGERFPSALCADEPSLEEGGEALSLAGLELLEFGVAACDEFNGAMVAYVLELLICSDGGASGAVSGGAATAVVICV